MKVRKRDGRIEDFKTENIKRTIRYAAQAVENEEADFKEHKEEYENLVNSMLEAGYNLEEARGIAEDQIGGYVLNGTYTEFDQDEADEVVDMVVDVLNELGDDIIDVDIIQDAIEKALITTDHTKTAREYISRRTQRDKVREMNSNLMKCFEGLTFKNSIDNDTKRENANIDGDSAMGTMLKYGSESAKEFNLLHLVSPDIADAHRNGDIHIHDLDFMALTQTCLVGDTMLTIKKNDNVKVVRACSFDKYLKDYPDDTVVKLNGIQILSKGEFVDIKNCVRHSSEGKRVIKISTRTTDITVTSEHKIPVVRGGNIIEVRADEISLGDTLLSDYKEHSRGLQSINLIDLFDDKSNIIIYNSDYVLDCVKSSGHWNDFCRYLDKNDLLRYRKRKLDLEDYIIHVRPLKCVDESKIKLAHKLFMSNITIDAIVSLTKEFGKFMGYMFCTSGTITDYFPTNGDRLANDFVKCVSSFLTDSGKGYKVCPSGTRIASGDLVRELFQGPLGYKGNHFKVSLPVWIYSANKDFLNGFYSALIDGMHILPEDKYRKDKHSMSYTSLSEQFIAQLQRLLVLDGIKSRIDIQKDQGTCMKYDTYTITITNDRYKFNWLESFEINENNFEKGSDEDSDSYNLVTKVEEVEYSGYVYDFETENHYFSANGITVHNCCQIDLLKLFKGGFNTGHGFLREPQDIRTAGALACIAIQSNQNDQHRSTV